jgi:ribosome-associated protein
MIEFLEDKKAVNIQLLDMRDVVSYADYLLICTGTSTTHSNALADHIEDSLSHEIKPVYRNPTKDKSWLILDYGDVIVHVFSESARLFYDLERLWEDAKRVDLSKLAG